MGLARFRVYAELEKRVQGVVPFELRRCDQSHLCVDIAAFSDEYLQRIDVLLHDRIGEPAVHVYDAHVAVCTNGVIETADRAGY